jgi:cytochrome c556
VSAAFGARLALLAGMLAASFAAAAQEQGLPPPKDTIFARKILMGTVDMNMDEVETMLAPGSKLDDAEAREHLNTISVLLMAFPHLFPAATNQWKDGADRDPALDTFASPELWSNFAEFYRRASEASKIAFEASRAARLDEFTTLVGQLRAACNSCHARFLKTE